MCEGVEPGGHTLKLKTMAGWYPVCLACCVARTGPAANQQQVQQQQQQQGCGSDE
jgi:hypothetical protein